jgi:hypothetical protein
MVIKTCQSESPATPSQWNDHDSFQQAFERLLRDLKAEAQKQ